MDVEFLKSKFQDSYDGVITKTKFKIGVRHVQMLYMFLSTVVMGAMRGCIGIEVLAIVDSTRRNDSYIHIHDWDRRVQGTIISSFFFGYALMLIPAEFYLKRLGDKFVITSVLLINGALSAAMPTIVNRGGWAAMCNAHFLMGMTQACISPINQVLLSKWLPPIERNTIGCLIDTGLYLGIIFAILVAGLLSETRLGWELIFYSQAIITLSMAVIWGLLTASSPEEHQAVGDSEKEYIKETLACYRKKRLQKPWRSILRSRQIWAILCSHAASNILFVFYLVDVPLYLKFLGLTLKECAQHTMFAFIALWFMYTTTAPIVDWFFKTGFVTYLCSVTNARKLVNALGAFSIVIGLMILPNITVEWPYLRISVLIGTLGILGFQYSGFLENLRDISQNYSGTLIVVSSSFASMLAAVTPLINGLILRTEVEDPSRWRILLSSIAGVYAFCNIIYTAFASSDRMDWDDIGKHKFGYHNSAIADNDTNELELHEINHKETIVSNLEDDTAI
ncbi:unnamed protein product [Parnassius apollo]|uniref:(apollo) hypothetical protein n=1 Tax=Parnassius apollo TaxID=110799 RepID=A0A8S3Y957_PARAO|nr:unnamed protein product [Parnassius apollo]